jgi:hypothetical protein
MNKSVNTALFAIYPKDIEKCPDKCIFPTRGEQVPKVRGGLTPPEAAFHFFPNILKLNSIFWLLPHLISSDMKMFLISLRKDSS